MRREGPARRLSIIICADDQYHHHPLYAEIVHRAHRYGLAGATVIHGVQGFGAATVLHQVHAIMDAAPVQIIIIDSVDRIDAFVPRIGPLVDNGLVLVEGIRAIRYDDGD